MEQVYKAEMEQTLDDLINRGELTEKSIFAFGHCNATEEMLDYLASHGCTVSAILDNNDAKMGLTYRCAQIVPPSNIQNYNADESIVLIATRFFDQMSAQLRRLRYDGKIVNVVDYNSFAEYSLSEETLDCKIERVRRGIITLESIRKQYPSHHLVVCPYNALGDVYWAMAFLPAYLKKHSIRKTAVIVTGKGCCQVADMFGAQNLNVLGRVEMDEFIQSLVFTGERNCVIAHHDRPYTDNIIEYLNKHFLSFIDYYRCAVYGLPKDTEPAALINAPFENFVGLIKDKSVILAPYAKSIVSPPQTFWKSLVNRYLQDGLTIFTSVVGNEQPIAGTQPLTLPLNRMISAAEYAGHFVGIRNGLCDVLNTAKCRKTVVFPDRFYSTTPHKVNSIFALPGWEEIICESAESSV